MLDINAITQDDARHVLHFFGREHGWQPGSFTQSLLELITKSDDINHQKLGKVYPGLVSAHYLATHEKNGIEILLGISTEDSEENVVAAANAILRGDF